MRIVFMGTPEFAEVALRAIADAFPDQIVGVVTRVDMPKNRGHALTPPPVKVAALSLGIPVFQPVNLKAENFADTLASLAPDLIVVAAYGKILPKYVLDAPRLGCINIHGSLLPKYRGAAPMQRAIMAGEPVMGVTIMRMAEGLDTGDMFEKGEIALDGTESFGEIHDRLAALGAKLVVHTMHALEDGTAVAVPQNDALSTYADKLTKADRLLDFSAPAEAIHHKIRALSPAPCAEALLRGAKVKFVRTALEAGDADGAPGTVSALSPKGDGTLIVNTGRGKLRVLSLIPEGKKEMTAGDFIRGRRIEATDRFETEPLEE